MRNLCLEMCYEGTRYRGWQRQSSTDNTIQGKLETTLSRILDENIEVHGSGRTDAGVHAEKQVVNFHCESTMDCQELLFQLRRYLPEDIGIRSCRQVPDRFHARLNARAKVYRYRIWTAEEPCIFQRRYVTVWPEKLDVERMRQASRFLLGEHDFSAFCANKHMKKSTVRRIDSIQIEEVGPELQITFTGNGFLHNMVRILVGTLVEVGQGNRTADSLMTLFGADRSQAGVLMPPQGLCLMEVLY